MSQLSKQIKPCCSSSLCQTGLSTLTGSAPKGKRRLSGHLCSCCRPGLCCPRVGSALCLGLHLPEEACCSLGQRCSHQKQHSRWHRRGSIGASALVVMGTLPLSPEQCKICGGDGCRQGTQRKIRLNHVKQF